MPWLIIIMSLISLMVITGGILFYRSIEKRTLNDKQNELAAISSLKIEDISKWRKDHIRDGEILTKNIPLIKHIAHFLNNDDNAELKLELLTWMQEVVRGYDYHSIFLLDTTRVVRLSYPPQDSISGNSLIVPASDVKDLSQIYFSDLHSSPDLPGIHIDLIIPLTLQKNGRKINIGTTVLRINPEKLLFPLIQSWPTPSRSSETLLLRVENDSILYLNELRHQKQTGLKFKLPLTDTLLPAAMVARGMEGPFEGIDYRKVKVVSYLKVIPDSPWFMVAKTDKKEVFSNLFKEMVLITLIMILIILFSSVSVGFVYRNQRIKVFRELNAAKDMFFSIISHDLKSPFTSIVGLSDLLIDKVKKNDLARTEKYATIIRDSSFTAMDLLNNLIEWSRLHSGRISFIPVLFDIVEVVDESVNLLSVSASQKSITIKKEMPAGLHLSADKVMISSVLRNLISNSIKFSCSGSEILISAFQDEKKIIIEVRDWGIGMKREILEKLFRIESVISLPGTHNEAGTGLGLILCKEFIARHGGTIWADSEPGKGSTFTFTIPKHVL